MPYNNKTSISAGFDINILIFEKLFVFEFIREYNPFALINIELLANTYKLESDEIEMISENEYNQLQKAKRNAEYLSMLERSMEEAKNGNIIVKSPEDFN